MEELCRNSIDLMEAFNNDLVIRYLDGVVVKDDGYEVNFKAGVDRRGRDLRGTKGSISL